MPEANLVAKAAREAGRDPLEALGLPQLPMTPEVGAMIMGLLQPELGERMREERELTRWKAEMEAKSAWEQALPGGRGYDGPRGVAWTSG